ncbi:tyrosine-type recombinase/integrase [Loktanella sp. Alg231-35]|uniref:tyrosine-type recombinase/integrase n=1 Tax=Loktanella sp. Alg231-35 TaxID=1922220 RepID=UPI000D55494A|nr:site-specific integrase [Loktanella sp. Alg231-35]
MASIRKRNNGKFCVQIRKSGLPAKSKTFDNQDAAKEWVKREEQAWTGQESPNAKPQHTLLSIGKLYCDNQLKGKPSRHLMLMRFERVAKHFEQPFLSITRVHVNEFKNKRMSQVSGPTVREEIQSINKLFRWTEREMIFGDITIGSPARNIALPPASKPITRVVEKEELHLLMADLNPLMREIVELAYETAMRRAEITKLLPRNIDIPGRTLLVEDGKTGDRFVPLTKRAVELLRGAVQRAATFDSRLYPVAPHSVSTAVRRARQRTGLGDHVRMHQLRHTRITEVAKRGFNQAQIMMVSGHRDSRSVQRYTHLSVKDVIDLID